MPEKQLAKRGGVHVARKHVAPQGRRRGADGAKVIGVVAKRGGVYVARKRVAPQGRRRHKKKRPLAHPPEPGYPCYVSVLGELAWMAPREEPTQL